MNAEDRLVLIEEKINSIMETQRRLTQEAVRVQQNVRFANLQPPVAGSSVDNRPWYIALTVVGCTQPGNLDIGPFNFDIDVKSSGGTLLFSVPDVSFAPNTPALVPAAPNTNYKVVFKSKDVADPDAPTDRAYADTTVDIASVLGSPYPRVQLTSYQAGYPNCTTFCGPLKSTLYLKETLCDAPATNITLTYHDHPTGAFGGGFWSGQKLYTPTADIAGLGAKVFTDITDGVTNGTITYGHRVYGGSGYTDYGPSWSIPTLPDGLALSRGLGYFFPGDTPTDGYWDLTGDPLGPITYPPYYMTPPVLSTPTVTLSVHTDYPTTQYAVQSKTYLLEYVLTRDGNLFLIAMCSDAPNLTTFSGTGYAWRMVPGSPANSLPSRVVTFADSNIHLLTNRTGVSSSSSQAYGNYYLFPRSTYTSTPLFLYPGSPTDYLNRAHGTFTPTSDVHGITINGGGEGTVDPGTDFVVRNQAHEHVFGIPILPPGSGLTMPLNWAHVGVGEIRAGTISPDSPYSSSYSHNPISLKVDCKHGHVKVNMHQPWVSRPIAEGQMDTEYQRFNGDGFALPTPACILKLSDPPAAFPYSHSGVYYRRVNGMQYSTYTETYRGQSCKFWQVEIKDTAF